MSQPTFDDDELIEEATEEIKTDVEDALSRADEALPAEDELLRVEDETLPVVLDVVDEKLEIQPVEDAVTDAQKAFVIGKRADAFENKYITETEATIAHLHEAIETLQEIDTAGTDLTNALSAYENLSAESPPTVDTETDPESEATSEAETDSDTAETTDSSSDSTGDTSEQDAGEDATTNEAQQADLTDAPSE